MNVTVSVFGRFHAFYLARELNRHGALDSLITSYPKWATGRWNVPKGRVRSLSVLEGLRRVLPAPVLGFLDERGLPNEAYDRLAARRLPDDPDIVVAWSGSAERTLRAGIKKGAVAVVERGSSHIRTQRAILQEEYSKHGLEPDLPLDWVIDKEEREYELADRIAVPSTFAEQTFLDQGMAREKLLRIPYGVDPEEFVPVPKEDDVFRVVYAGALGVRKGTRYLLDSFRAVELPDAELLLLGRLQPEVEPWLARGGEKVRHPGHIDQDELHRWYSQGSVFVMPSLEEGMAMVQLQAMACGLPLICTPCTGGGDLIEDGREGFVVPAGDAEALRDRIAWCYENQETLREMGRAARRRILEDYTWQDYGQRIFSAYGELLRERGKRS